MAQLDPNQPARPSLARLLWRAARLVEAELQTRLRDSGYPDIRPAHSAVFAFIDVEGTRPVDLARRADMTKQSMGELIEDLEAKGYVRRVVSPDDKRHRLVVLSDRGRQHLEDTDAVQTDIEASFERRVGAAAMRSMRGALRTLTSDEPVAPKGKRAGSRKNGSS